MKQIGFLLILFLGSIAHADIRPEVVLTTGHSDQINAMVISPNGRFLASAGNNKIIKIWEIATTQEYRSLSGMDGRVNDLVFSRDNIHLAGVSSHGELFVWNVLTGEEVYRLEEGGSMARGLSFTKNGKGLVHSNRDGYLTVTDLASGTSKISESYVISMVLDTNKQIVYSLDHLGNLLYFNLESETVERTVKLFDEFNYPFSRLDVSPDGKLLACGFNDDRIRFYDTDEHRFVYTSAQQSSKIVDIKFDPIYPSLYLTLANGGAQILDYKNYQVTLIDNPDPFSAQCLTAHPNGNIIILANSSTVNFYGVKQKKVFKKLKSKVSAIHSITFDPNEQYLAVASNKVKIQIWDLKRNKVTATLPGFFPCEFSKDGKYLFLQQYDLTIGAFNIEKGIVEYSLDTKYQLQQKMAVTDDGKYLAAGGIGMTINIWNLESKKLKGTLQGHTGLITGLDFNSEGTLLASSSYDQTTKVWDMKSLKMVQNFEDQKICISDAEFSPDGSILATSAWDQTINFRETDGWNVTHTLKGHSNMITSIDFNKDGSLLTSCASNNAVSHADNSVMIWDVKTGSQKCVIKDHLTGVNQVVFDDSNDRIFSASDDGTVKINDHTTCSVVATYVAIDDNDFMIYTPDNYYIASKNALKGIAFRIDNALVPFEQFDAYLNRPDIVAKRIGKSSDQIIKAYYYLYKKRLRKLNIEEGDLKIDYKIPYLINETNYDLVTSESTFKLWIKAWDDVYDINQINVYVNDVPVFGEDGYRPEKQVKSIRKQFEIPLVSGANKIQLSCVNSNGAQSLLETIDIIRETSEEKHDLYIVSIGVSDYQDDRFKLTYPKKDATDVINKIGESSVLYNQIHTKLMVDVEATRDNFEGLKTFFEPCTHEDLAIIFIAGHGVLDENFDYYFGTYDMDFEHPAEKGLAYEEIHSMLNKIRAFRKLLIMDTCHSGELDKEEVEAGPPVEFEEGDVKFRAGTSMVKQKVTFGSENSIEFMQDLFSDTRKGSGATVISSAGGAEFAMESDEWKNGLFTYSLLFGLSHPELVGDKDKVITVSEIRHYVHGQVKELSHGLQIPSSREENISQDYIIFGNQ